MIGSLLKPNLTEEIERGDWKAVGQRPFAWYRREQIIQNRHRTERSHDLEGTPDSEASAAECRETCNLIAAKINAPRVGIDGSCNEIEHCRLPSTVGPKQAKEFTLVDNKIDVFHGNNAAELLSHAVRFEKLHFSSRCWKEDHWLRRQMSATAELPLQQC